MQEIELPLVPDDATLDDALQRMREHGSEGCSAIVVGSAHGAYLLTLATLLDRWNELIEQHRAPGPARIRDVAPYRKPPGVELDVDDIGDVFVTTAAPGHDGPPVFRTRPRSLKTGYDVLRLDGFFARVLTASERYAAQLGATYSRSCCAGKPVHCFAPGTLKNPDVCNYPHRAPIQTKQVGRSP